jgi:hypothetical protein
MVIGMSASGNGWNQRDLVAGMDGFVVAQKFAVAGEADGRAQSEEGGMLL